MNIFFDIKEFGVGYKINTVIGGELFESKILFDTEEDANDCIARIKNNLIDKTVILEAR